MTRSSYPVFCVSSDCTKRLCVLHSQSSRNSCLLHVSISTFFFTNILSKTAEMVSCNIFFFQKLGNIYTFKTKQGLLLVPLKKEGMILWHEKINLYKSTREAAKNADAKWIISFVVFT